MSDCMCAIHLRLTPDKPCLGHGEGCPCTDLIQKQKEDVEKKEANELST